MPIRFFYEETDFRIRNSRKVADWVKESTRLEKKTLSEINYVFCSDEFLLRLNQQFLNHDTFTDIITFDYSLKKEISGEIYISIQRVIENAEKFNSNFQDELLRVMIHGILHLIGYNDKKPSESAYMRKKEEAYLSLWKKMFHVKR